MSACAGGWLPAAGGWVEPSGAVQTAAETPSDGPSNVQADLDALFAQIAGIVVIDSVAKLEAEFPNVAGVHTINKQTIWVSQTGAPFDLTTTGRSIELVDPGTMVGIGGLKVLVLGNLAGPLCFGEPVVSNMAFKNVNAGGTDVAWESLSGRYISITNVVLLGQNAGTISNVLGVLVVDVLLLQPSSPGATGLIIDGVNAVILLALSASAPAGGTYTAIALAATSVIAADMRIDGSAIFGTIGDALLDVNVAATLPTSPAPTNVVGFEVFGCAIKGGASLFKAGGLDHTDIRILSSQNTGGPTSAFIGDARANTTITPTPTPIAQAYTLANTWEVVPSDNTPTAAPDDVVLTINTALTQRHSVQIVSRQDWSLRYDGPEDALIAIVSWKASADRPGGAASVVDAQLEYDNGGGWLPLVDTRDTITLLSGTPQVMSGRTVIPVADSGFDLRLVSRTDTQPTVTDWHDIEISKGI